MIAASQHDTLDIIKRLAQHNTSLSRLAYRLLVRYTKKAACISGAQLLRAASGVTDISAFLNITERVTLGEDYWDLKASQTITAAQLASMLLQYVNLLKSMYGLLGIPLLYIQQLLQSGIYIKDMDNTNG